jgi:hypothetical protein
MQEQNISSSHESLSQANFQSNEQDRALLANRETVRQRYGLDPELTVIAGTCFQEPSSYQEEGAPLWYKNFLDIPLYSCESQGQTHHHLVLNCTANAHLDGSGASIDVWHRFPVLHDVNWTVLQLRRGIAQMIEVIGPVTPGESLPIHLLGGDPKGFVIYNDLHKILLVQRIDYKEQDGPTSEWQVFAELERTIDNWRGSSGPLRLRNTLSVTFAESGDTSIAATLVLNRLGGWFSNGIYGTLTLPNESRKLKHYTDSEEHRAPHANQLLTTESASRWPRLRLPLEEL